MVCGPRPSEFFLLRDDDIGKNRISIDQALKEAEKGARRMGEPGDTKTPESAGYIAASPGIRFAKFRVIVPLSNLPPFAEAFGCKKDLPMVRPAAGRCEVR